MLNFNNMTQLTYERKLENSEWEEMELTCEDKSIEVSCDLGRITMSHEDFDNLVYHVNKYREMTKIINLETE